MVIAPRRCRNAVIVAPHADDETIGAFALIDRLRRRGVGVWVVVVTDGAASHPGSRRWPPPRLRAERRRETRRAMAMLNIAPDRIRFLDLPDGGLAEDRRATQRRCDRAFRRLPRPDLIVGPVPDDAHPDHRAVAAAIAGLRPRVPRRLGYPVWPLGHRRGCRLVLRLDPCQRAAKRQALLSYRTQAGLITDAPTGMTIRDHHLRAFAGPVERFRSLR